MTKGLKQMVADATKAPEPEPVHVSGEAVAALSRAIRLWTGWPDARLVLGDPRDKGRPSPYASTNMPSRTVVINPDTLVRNPNRVLITVTPFRLRQEAVLTGAMLHEAGHARHSLWLPATIEQAQANPLVHKLTGTPHYDQPPNEQCISLATLMEETRIEGLIARDENQIGAHSLGWTMRAMAAHITAHMALSPDPNQQVMDVITSWAMRAGRQYALDARLPNYRMRGWVAQFTNLLRDTIHSHLTERVAAGATECNPDRDTKKIIDGLIAMTVVDDDTGSTMIDLSRTVLDLLFPETPGETSDDEAMAGTGCGMSAEPESGEDGEGDEGEQGEGNSEPEDEGEGDDPGAGDAGDEDDGESEDGDGDPEDGDDEPESDEDGEPEDGEGDGATGSTDSTDTDTESDLAKALAAMEAAADGQTEADAEEAHEDAEEEAAQGNGAGIGDEDRQSGAWRNPTAEERDMGKAAGKFLRSMIDTSETSKVSLVDTPSSQVDGAALAAWKAGGQRTDPRFFRQTRRRAEPSAPVKIAVLVDVSISMSELQKPSALLSWALTSAALDLRNFAGRGQQIESCLIHWGDSVHVRQAVGETLPGIREHDCNEGTSAMGEALAEVERQMPGFFDITERPVNRLIVQFSDWIMRDPGKQAEQYLNRAMAAGVNMVSVVPGNWVARYAVLNDILKRCPVQRGTATLMRYDRRNPAEVWSHAAEMLS